MSGLWALPACLHERLSAADHPASEGAFLTLAVVVWLCLALAALLSRWVLQERYRRRVAALMNFESVHERPQAWWDRSPFGCEPVNRAANPVDQGSSPLNRQMLAHAQQRIAWASGAAWLSFSLGAWLCVRWTFDAPGLLLQLGVPAATLLATLSLVLANMPPAWARWKSASLRWGGLVGGVVVVCQPGWEEAGAALLFLGAWLGLNLRASRGLLRALWLLLGLSMVGLLLPVMLLTPLGGSCWQQTMAQSEASLIRASLLALSISWVVLGGYLAWRGIAALARALMRGRLGELSASLLLDLSLVALVLVSALRSSAADTAAPQTPSSGEVVMDLLSGLMLCGVCLGLAVAAYVWVLRCLPARPGRAPHLLMLRVFSREEKQQDLLDQLQAHWRYIGPVSQIGGPDLAPRNIGLFVSLMFLSGRLHELFLPRASEPRRLRKRLQLEADQEGRFRVNEVFCFNSAWQGTVEQLMQLADVIVLDLRGFSAERQGTAYELHALQRAHLLSRVWVLRDSQTRWPDVLAALEEEGAPDARGVQTQRLLEQQCWDCDARDRPEQQAQALQDWVHRLAGLQP